MQFGSTNNASFSLFKTEPFEQYLIWHSSLLINLSTKSQGINKKVTNHGGICYLADKKFNTSN